MSEPERDDPFDAAMHERMTLCFNICQGADIEDLELILKHKKTLRLEIRALANRCRLYKAPT